MDAGGVVESRAGTAGTEMAELITKAKYIEETIKGKEVTWRSWLVKLRECSFAASGHEMNSEDII